MKTKICTCGKKIIFLQTIRGNYSPFVYDSLDETDKKQIECGDEIMFDSKKHKSHFADCPQAHSFRKKKPV